MAGVAMIVGCAKKEAISDSDLEKITQEMFLVNAYATAHKVNTDSVDIYTPILQKYGYTQEDFLNSLANFQKRKSARFGDIIEHSVANLEEMQNHYKARLKKKQHIDSLLKAECQEVLLTKDTLRVTKMKDTTRLKFSIPVKSSGELVVSYNYFVDTLDKNLRLQSNHALYNAEGGRLHILRNNLTSGGKQMEYKTTIAIKEGATVYELSLADYARRNQEPNIAFGHIKVVYLPPVEVAQSRMDSLVWVRTFDPEVDSVFRRTCFVATPPLLPSDTIWTTSDSLRFIDFGKQAALADSLADKASKLRTERDKYASKNRGKNSARITEKMNNFREQIDSLEGEAAYHSRLADSMEFALFGLRLSETNEQ